MSDVCETPGSCPFCGNTDVTLWEDDSISRYYVSCGECWTTGPDVDVRSEAIRLWNLPNKRLEDLRAEYERRNESVIKLGHVHLGQEPEHRKGHERKGLLPHAIWLLAGALVRQTRKGWQKYHSLLCTENGRDAGRDWLEEQADALMYGTQLILENRALRAENARLRKQLNGR